MSSYERVRFGSAPASKLSPFRFDALPQQTACMVASRMAYTATHAATAWRNRRALIAHPVAALPGRRNCRLDSLQTSVQGSNVTLLSQFWSQIWTARDVLQMNTLPKAACEGHRTDVSGLSCMLATTGEAVHQQDVQNNVQKVASGASTSNSQKRVQRCTSAKGMLAMGAV